VIPIVFFVHHELQSIRGWISDQMYAFVEENLNKLLADPQKRRFQLLKPLC
jgi:hypothetical protein